MSKYTSEAQFVSVDTAVLYAMPKGALYWCGVLCKDITGGWVSNYPSNVFSEYVMNNSQFRANDIYFTLTNTSVNKSISASTNNKISLLKYSKLYVNLKQFRADSSMASGGTYLSVELFSSRNVKAKDLETTKTGELVLDISTITLDCWIGLRVVVSSTISTSFYATVDKVWLE